jgi:hypothetical protein
VPQIDDGSTNRLLTTVFGRWPFIDYKTELPSPVSWCNGGIPQLANYSAHLKQMTLWLDKITPPDYDGLLVWDLEQWWPTWNGTNNELYKNASLALARKQLPAGATDQEVKAKAQRDFTNASLSMYIFTNEQTKRLRPNARVGWYGGLNAPYWTDDLPRTWPS